MEDKVNKLAQIIDSGGDGLKLNNWANGLFSLKSVIARIVKACVPEYTTFTYKLIEEECLDDYQSGSGNFHSEIAKALMTKRPLPNSFMMDCDLLFELRPPKHLLGDWKPQLLNIEIQNDSRRLDRCIGRSMLYASGIYYMEYDLIYTYPMFEDTWKVNSVWICPAVPEERQGTILDIKTTAQYRQDGGCLQPPSNYDRLRLTFLNAGGDDCLAPNNICGFIWTLTTTALTAEQRKRILKEVYQMQMTQVVEKEIDNYDWMLDSYGRKRFAEEKKQCREEGRKEGKEEGREEGRKEGKEEGREEGREAGRKEGREEGEKNGFAKGCKSEMERIAINMLKFKYQPEEISRLIGMDIATISKIAMDNNLSNS